jgi:hypothetical protein
MKRIQLFKEGFDSVSPYECELKAYEAKGWNQEKKTAKMKKNDSKQKIKPTKNEQV